MTQKVPHLKISHRTGLKGTDPSPPPHTSCNLGICLMCFYFPILPFCPFAKSICFQKAFPNFNYGNNSSLAFTQVYSIVPKCNAREAVQEKSKEYLGKGSTNKGVGKVSISGSYILSESFLVPLIHFVSIF